MTDTLTNLDRIEDLVRRLERLGINPAGLFPDQRAAIDAYNNPGYVAAGELIESAWGNAASGHVVRAYPTAAARNAENPTPFVGQVTYVESNNSVQLRDSAGIWIEPGGSAWGVTGVQSGIGQPVTILGSGWSTRSADRRYKVSIYLPVFKAGVAGSVTININPAVPGIGGLGRDFGTPESGTMYGAWIVSGAVSGGAFYIQAATGTVDVLAGGYVSVEDIGALTVDY